MAKSVQCQLCSKAATVHLTQIINGQVRKIDLCEACAQKKGVTNFEGFALAELLSKTLGAALAGNITKDAPSQPQAADLQCPACGCTVAELKKTGRVGCAQCYTVLRSVLAPVIKNLHKNKTHKGKEPKTQLARVNRMSRIETLEKELAAAVREERYEDAARYHGELQTLKSEVSVR